MPRPSSTLCLTTSPSWTTATTSTRSAAYTYYLVMRAALFTGNALPMHSRYHVLLCCNLRCNLQVNSVYERLVRGDLQLEGSHDSSPWRGVSDAAKDLVAQACSQY